MALALLVMIGWSSLAMAAVNVTASVSRPEVRQGQPLLILITAFNTADEPVTLEFGSTAQVAYVLDGGVYEDGTVGGAAMTYRTIPARGSYTWSMEHRWDAYNIPLGRHFVVGRVKGVGPSGSIQFEVVGPRNGRSDGSAPPELPRRRRRGFPPP